MHAHSNAFNSSRVITQKAQYLGNGTDDRSQTWTKVSCNGVYIIDKYCNRNFHEKSHTEGFPRFGDIYTLLALYTPCMHPYHVYTNRLATVSIDQINTCVTVPGRNRRLFRFGQKHVSGIDRCS